MVGYIGLKSPLFSKLNILTVLLLQKLRYDVLFYIIYIYINWIIIIIKIKILQEYNVMELQIVKVRSLEIEAKR